MEYNDYKVTEAEYDEIKAQHLAGKIIEDQVYYVKELNRLYKINHLLRIRSIIILENRIVDDKEELINKKAYINGKLHSEYHYNGEMSTEKIYNKTNKLGTKTVTRYYKHGKLHKTDGPAVEYEEEGCGDYYYYVNGRWITKKFFNEITKNIKNGNVINILDGYDYEDLITIKTMIEEIGDEKQLEVVNKYLVVRRLANESE